MILPDFFQIWRLFPVVLCKYLFPYSVHIFLSSFIPFTEDVERASPTEQVAVESKTESTDDLLDSKDHVNVIFIGHVGRSIILYIRRKILSR